MNQHMTSQDWAQYIQTFEPSTDGELATYLTDLLNYSKGGNFEAGIALNRCKQLINRYPEVFFSMEYKKIDGLSRTSQSQIREGFYRK